MTSYLNCIHDYTNYINTTLIMQGVLAGHALINLYIVYYLRWMGVIHVCGHAGVPYNLQNL